MSTAFLSDRECQIVSLLARGLSVEDVGQELGLSVKAMRTYKSRIQDKLGVPDATGIRLWASPVRNAELARLTGRGGAERLEVAA